ncbi:MAG: 4a-hydroxytetrahydrobiopterin dehydratase [archaeon]|jgi:4a-hydroxytetrahydrobiopterin dehydratase
MVDLSEIKCEMDEGRMFLLNEDEIDELLKQVWGWRIEDDFLLKEYAFPSLVSGLAFANKIAMIASQENQNPKILLQNEKVEVYLQTNQLEGLSRNDFIFASKIDKLLR